jgi:hypothetical protein
VREELVHNVRGYLLSHVAPAIRGQLQKFVPFAFFRFPFLAHLLSTSHAITCYHNLLNLDLMLQLYISNSQ